MTLRVLTWPAEPRYLRSLSCIPHELYVVAPPAGPVGPLQALPGNVQLVAAEEVRGLSLDCVLYQSSAAWQVDREAILSPEQRRLPAIYLEHRPPSQHPTDQRHPVDDTDTLLVHVSHFNALAWDNGRTPVRVIEHGVQVPEGVLYSGKLPRGVTAVDDLVAGGRRLGADVFAAVREEVPLDLVGRDARRGGGLGQVPPSQLPAFMSAYRFYFEPSRQAGPSLELCEAMMIGIPVLALATAGLGAVVRSGVTGHLDASPRELIAHMRELLASPGEAWRLGQAARRAARERFDLRRFVRDWDHALRSVAGGGRYLAPLAGVSREFAPLAGVSMGA